MKQLYVSLLLTLYCLTTNGQGYFTSLPRDLQLYPRNAANQAEVVFSGVTDAGYTKISVQTLRAGKLTGTLSQTGVASASGFAFRLAPIIKAEPAEYEFKVFLHKNTDSVLVVNPKRVVCGDVYLIHGQSNAIPTGGLAQYYSTTFDDTYLRTVDYIGDPAAIRWYPAKEPFASVGEYGLSIQRYILVTYGIPTVCINGADGGKDIELLTQRNPANPADVTTRYGRLLYRAQWAGVAKQAKAIIWKQGEADAGSGTPGYQQKFDQFYKNLRADYGNDARLYVSQINILDNAAINGQVDIAPQIRDFQRRIKFLYANTETIATVGTLGYGGIHYDTPANRQLAFEQYRQIARDVYGATDTLQINSPDIKKVYYNTRRDSVTLVFDDQMQMVWKADSATYDFSNGKLIKIRYLKDVFYLDGQAGLVTGGSASQNRVVLSLKQPATARSLRYLPSYFSEPPLSEAYDGPALRNTRGMRAFSFDNVPIADVLPAVTTLAAQAVSDKQIQLTWTASASATTQVLERAVGTPTGFTTVATLSGTVTTFTDDKLAAVPQTYYYRLRSLSASSESAFGNVASATVKPVVVVIVLANEPVVGTVRLFPNPVAAGGWLRVEADQAQLTGLTLRDSQGRVVKSWLGSPQKNLQFSVTGTQAGLYFAELQTTGGREVRRVVIIP